MISVRLAWPRHVLCVAVLVASPVLSADPCDPDVRPPANTPYAYKLRGDRCEGLYIRSVAGNTLNIVSLTEWFEDFATGANRNLRIEWAAPGNARIHLRAVAVRPKLYYRMDVTRLPQSASFVWQSNILKELQLTRSEIGLLGWTLQTIGGTQRPVYVPLRISQQRPAQRSPRYRLVVLPGIELSEVYLSITALRGKGAEGKPLVDGEPLERGQYSAHRPISIDLPPLPAAGIYLLEIGATVRGGGSAADQILLYSPGVSPAPGKVPARD